MSCPTTFLLFSSFPTEIRLLIWTFALPSTRLISWNKSATIPISQPIPLHTACHESKAVLETTFTRMIHRRHVNNPFYLNLHSDAIHYSLLFCHIKMPNPRIIMSDPRDPRGGVRRVWNRSFVRSLKRMVANCYHYVLTAHPCVEEIYIVLTKSEGCDATVMVTEREEFLRFLKERAGYDLWMEEGPVLVAAKRQCQNRHTGVAGYVWRMPRVVFDIEDLVVGGEQREERKGYNMNLVKGEPNAELSNRWAEEMDS